MKNKLIAAAILGTLFLGYFQVEARSKRVNQIPNGKKNDCVTCHISDTNDGLNPFGQQIYNNFLTSKNSSGNVIWNAALAALDADGDGYTNGQELSDPNGAWVTGQSNPGNIDNVSNPGQAGSIPTLSSVFENMVSGINSIAVILNITPNPANQQISLSFNLKNSSFIKIDVVNINGNVESNIVNNQLFTAGDYKFNWDLKNNNGEKVQQGVYLIRVIAGTEMISSKMIVY